MIELSTAQKEQLLALRARWYRQECYGEIVGMEETLRILGYAFGFQGSMYEGQWTIGLLSTGHGKGGTT